MKISIVLAVLAVMVAIQAVPIPDTRCNENTGICSTPGTTNGDGGDGDGGNGADETDPEPEVYEAYSKREVSAEPETEAKKVGGDEEPETKAEDQGDKDKDEDVIDEDF
ncbi:hypothetical protein BGZ98_002763 [Dissophora globulifera]|nr:hypothetical protein BGZ98_002763 [Dissophora globulifera]